MKFIIVILLICVTNNLVCCGIVDDALNTVKKTGISVTDNVSGWWHSGKEYIFGEDISKKNTTEEVNKGLLPTVYDKVNNFFTILGERIKKEPNAIVKILYEAVTNRLKKLKDVDTNKEKHTDNSEQENENKPNDTISRVFFGKNKTYAIANKDSVNKLGQLLDEVEVKGKNLSGQAKSAYEKQLELLKTQFKKIQDGALIVGNDAKKLKNAVSNAVYKDLQYYHKKNINAPQTDINQL